jgi:hypothetical protein
LTRGKWYVNKGDSPLLPFLTDVTRILLSLAAALYASDLAAFFRMAAVAAVNHSANSLISLNVVSHWCLALQS